MDEPRYWQSRYEQEDTPWDIGYPAPALMNYVQNLPRQSRILIPGAGRGHEAVALHRLGYGQLWVCDWAEAALQAIKEQAPDFPDDHLLLQDFFSIGGSFDLVLEQTFLSALPPDQWPSYTEKMHRLLLPGGRLAGLLFAQPFEHEGPPHGAYPETYRRLFSPLFTIHQLRISELSIGPRLGRELFVEMSPKTDI